MSSSHNYHAHTLHTRGRSCAVGAHTHHAGYTGNMCSECAYDYFYFQAKCEMSCSDIEPRGVTTAHPHAHAATHTHTHTHIAHTHAR